MQASHKTGGGGSGKDDGERERCDQDERRCHRPDDDGHEGPGGEGERPVIAEGQAG